MKSIILLQIVVGVFLSVVPHCGTKKEYPVQNDIVVMDDVNISVTPEQLKYSIGDTIWISAEISEEDLLVNSDVEGLTNGEAIFSFRIFKLAKAYVYFNEGAADFDLIYSNGDIQAYSNSNSKVTRRTDLEYQNKMYSFNIGLIAKVKGDYSFYTGSIDLFYDNMPESSFRFFFTNLHFLVNENNKNLFENLGYSDKIFIGESTENYSLPLTDSTRFLAFSVNE